MNILWKTTQKGRRLESAKEIFHVNNHLKCRYSICLELVMQTQTAFYFGVVSWINTALLKSY